MSQSSDLIIPVHVLSGRLGSGKTTLLNASIRHPAMARTALIISEFGPQGIDQMLIQSSAGQVLVLENGCVCCTASSELVETLTALQTQRRRGTLDYVRIVVECSGLSELAPVLQAVLLASPFGVRLGRVVTVVDAVSGGQCILDDSLFAVQLALADLLVLSKTDLAGDSGAILLNQLSLQYPSTPIQQGGTLDPNWLDSPTSVPKAAEALLLPSFPRQFRQPDKVAHAGLQSLALTVQLPLNWLRLTSWLQRLVDYDGDSLLRVKAVVRIEGTQNPVAIHIVDGRLYPPSALESWNGEPLESRLVFILRGLKPADVRDAFEAQVSTIHSAIFT